MGEMWPLIKRQWKETSPEADTDSPDPDWEQYLLLEKSRRLALLTLRSDGILGGYILFLLTRDMHRKSIVKACVDTYFVDKEFRTYPNISRMFGQAADGLRGMAVKRIIGHVNEYFSGENPAIDRLFEMMGYDLIGRVYERVL